MNFLDIILEADNKKIKIQPSKDVTDYLKEAEKEEDPDEESGEDLEGDSGLTEDDDEATDYTEEDDPSLDDEDTDGEEPTDYTEEENDGTDEGDDGDPGDESTEIEEEPEETPESENLKENTRILLKDFSTLYYTVKNTMLKLSNINKSNISVNKICTQISKNLSVLEKQLFEFITHSFLNGKYVNNLYKYNYFLQAFKINVEMLKKVSVFIPNSQNN